jgi:hypothetical protein
MKLKTVNARKSQNFLKVNTFHLSLYCICPCSRSVLNFTDTNPVSNPQRRVAKRLHAGTSTDWKPVARTHWPTGGPTKLLRATPASVPTLCAGTKSPLKRCVRRDGTSRNHHITHHGYLPMMHRSVLFYAFLLSVFSLFSNFASNNMSLWWPIMWFAKYCIAWKNI